MQQVKRALAVLSLSTLPFAGMAFGAVEDEAGGRVPPDMGAGSTPSGYSIPPVAPKSLKSAENHPWQNKEVRNMQGEMLGTIENVMVDTQSGKEYYAMLKMADRMSPTPIPLGHFREAETGLVLNAGKDQLEPGGPNLGGRTKSQDFEHMGSEPLKPNLRQGGN